EPSAGCTSCSMPRIESGPVTVSGGDVGTESGCAGGGTRSRHPTRSTAKRRSPAEVCIGFNLPQDTRHEIRDTRYHCVSRRRTAALWWWCIAHLVSRISYLVSPISYLVDRLSSVPVEPADHVRDGPHRVEIEAGHHPVGVIARSVVVGMVLDAEV